MKDFVYIMSFNFLIDSKWGETMKNLAKEFVK